MIKLLNQPISLQSWKAPGTYVSGTLTAGASHVINHPLGRRPDYVKAVIASNGEVVNWFSYNSAINNDLQLRGMVVSTSSNTQITVEFYRMQGQGNNIPMEITLYLLGDS